MTELSSLVWMVAIQFLLYAAGWWLCGWLLREQRAALLHWGAFMLLVGAGFALVSLRGEPRTWPAFVGSNVLFISGFVALRRGLEHFVGVRPRDAEHLLTWGGAALALAAVGPRAEHAAWRVIVAYGVASWIFTRAAWVAMPPLRVEFGRRLTWLLAVPAVLLVLISLERLLRQGLALDQPLELHGLDHSNRAILYGYLAGAAMFSFSFMGLVVTRLLKRMRHLSQHDPLTGLVNRRALEAQLHRELQRAQRSGGTLALLSVDIDHFKRVNDEHGHPAGDAVLVQAGQRLLQAARTSDTVARTGGEEFIVLMPATGLEAACAAAERIRCAIAACPFVVDGASPGLAMSVSIGVAQAASGETETSVLMQRVDRALYRAKHAGRNCVAM